MMVAILIGLWVWMNFPLINITGIMIASLNNARGTDPKDGPYVNSVSAISPGCRLQANYKNNFRHVLKAHGSRIIFFPQVV